MVHCHAVHLPLGALLIWSTACGPGTPNSMFFFLLYFSWIFVALIMLLNLLIAQVLPTMGDILRAVGVSLLPT